MEQAKMILEFKMTGTRAFDLLGIERLTILECLRHHDGAIEKSATALGINRRTLYRKLGEYEKAGLYVSGRKPRKPRTVKRSPSSL